MLNLAVSIQDELLYHDYSRPTCLNSLLLRGTGLIRQALEQAENLLTRSRHRYHARHSPWTYHDLPGICTHGPRPPYGESLYETGLPLLKTLEVARVLDPDHRAYCVHLYSSREISSYEQVHEMAFGPQPGPTTYMAHLHPVPSDTVQRPEDLWFRPLSHDGNTVIVENSGATVWETEPLLKQIAVEDRWDRRKAAAFAQEALSERAKERDLSNPQALAYAMPLARLAALQQLQNRHQLSPDPATQIRYALGRTTEVIDRAYNLARMRLAGVDLEENIQYLTYQHFYERGMAPPTHEEMADVAISDLT